ncbi:hypothetical protein ACFLQ8_01325 [Candidatus Auribacterota bacterium]
MLSKQQDFILETENKILTGRDNGRAELNKLSEYMNRSPADSVVPINFSNTKFIDFSSCDEFLGKLISRIGSREFNNVYIYLTNVTKEIAESIDAMLTLRAQNVILVENNTDIKILGKLNPILKETLDYINTEKEVSARKLADVKKIAINTSSNRLTKLNQLGLIARLETTSTKSTEQYLYTSLI